MDLLKELSIELIEADRGIALCAVFYLFWWLVTFRPGGVTKGSVTRDAVTWDAGVMSTYGDTGGDGVGVMSTDGDLGDGNVGVMSTSSSAPLARRSSILGNLCLALAAVTGLAAFARTTWLLSEPVTFPHPGIPRSTILLAGILSYFILLAISVTLFRRKVTSELFLITAWATLQFSVVNWLFRAGSISGSRFLILTPLLALVTLIDLICYLSYYRLSPQKSYIIGCIPLILAALTTALI